MTRESSILRRAAVALIGGSVAFSVVAGPVAAMTSSAPALQVRAVDARNGSVTIDVFQSGTTDARKAQVTIAGKRVTAAVAPLAKAGLPSSAVVVLDNSAALPNGSIQLAKEAIATLVPGSNGLTKVGVVTTGGRARAVVRPTDSADEVAAGISKVAPTGGSTTWDGVVLAADLLEGTGETQRNIILVSGSPDTGTGASFTQAVTAARTVGASVHLIALAGSGAPFESLADIANRAGGSKFSGTDDEFDTMLAAVVKRIAGQYRFRVAVPPKLSGELVSLKVTVGPDEANASFRPGVLSVGSEALSYVAPVDESGGLFSGTFVKLLIVGLGSLAVVGIVFSVAQLALKRKDGLDYALRHYDETYGTAGAAEVDGQALAQSAFMRRAVEMTGDLAEKQGFLTRVEALLERADLPLRPAEALFFYLAFAFVSVLVALVLTGNPFASLAVAIVALVLPSFAVDFLAKRRKKKFVAILPDMLQLLSGTLRAGYSIAQAFEAISTEVSEPMGKELRRAVTEARLGRPMEEALEGIARRMASDDFEWAVMAIRIQREVGGNLAELLMTVADTMTQRERLRRDVASLTAEGKISAMVLGFLPPGLSVAMYVMNPDYIKKLFSGTGLYLLAAAVVAMLIGFVWMKKTITIEV